MLGAALAKSLIFDILIVMSENVFPDKVKIQSHTMNIVPRYVETDKAGVIHHSVYPVWFELGRTEWLRVNGLAYSKLEEAGVYFVVAELSVKYRRAARYDEELALETQCTGVTGSRVKHSYKLRRCADGVILAEGSSVLACVDADGKVCRVPDFMYPEPAETNV